MPDTPIRSLAELIDVYHHTVGQNGVLEIDFAIDRTGRVDPAHAQRYSDFGNWIRSCYGTPLASTSGNGSSLILTLPSPLKVDRIILQENQAYGQRIRAYTVEMAASEGGTWSSFTQGTSIGNKRIDIRSSGSVVVAQLRLTVSSALAPPIFTHFGAYAPCSTS